MKSLKNYKKSQSKTSVLFFFLWKEILLRNSSLFDCHFHEGNLRRVLILNNIQVPSFRVWYRYIVFILISMRIFFSICFGYRPIRFAFKV